MKKLKGAFVVLGQKDEVAVRPRLRRCNLISLWKTPRSSKPDNLCVTRLSKVIETLMLDALFSLVTELVICRTASTHYCFVSI